jgi:hypothetical protein
VSCSERTSDFIFSKFVHEYNFSCYSYSHSSEGFVTCLYIILPYILVVTRYEHVLVSPFIFRLTSWLMSSRVSGLCVVFVFLPSKLSIISIDTGVGVSHAVQVPPHFVQSFYWHILKENSNAIFIAIWWWRISLFHTTLNSKAEKFLTAWTLQNI